MPCISGPTVHFLPHSNSPQQTVFDKMYRSSSLPASRYHGKQYLLTPSSSSCKLNDGHMIVGLQNKFRSRCSLSKYCTVFTAILSLLHLPLVLLYVADPTGALEWHPRQHRKPHK